MSSAHESPHCAECLLLENHERHNPFFYTMIDFRSPDQGSRRSVHPRGMAVAAYSLRGRG